MGSDLESVREALISRVTRGMISADDLRIYTCHNDPHIVYPGTHCVVPLATLIAERWSSRYRTRANMLQI